MDTLRCNGCGVEHEPGSQAVASSCKHFFCMKCAQALLAKDEQCPMCDSMLSKSSMKMVHALKEFPQGQLHLMLCGQTPSTIMQSAQAGINFYMEQQRLNQEYQKQQVQQRMQKMQQQCKTKLEEVHNGYKQAKRKYQEAAQARNAVEQDNQELQQKYSQKAMQYRKLAEMFKQLQQENAELKRHQGMAGGMSGGASDRAQQMVQFGRSAGTGAQMVTTVQHQRSIIELSPQSGNGNMFLHGHGSATVGGGGGQMRVQRPPAGGSGAGNGGFGDMFGGGTSPNLGGMLVPGNMQQRCPGTSGGMFAVGNRAAAGGSGGGTGMGMRGSDQALGSWARRARG